MLWLQCELAAPLAMLVLCALSIPIWRSGLISMHAYPELRLDLGECLLPAPLIEAIY